MIARMDQFRVYDSGPPWLLTLYVDLPTVAGVYQHLFARAVVDDFGDLVIVRGWL